MIMLNHYKFPKRKAQVTTEIIVVLAIAFFVFIVFLSIILSKEGEIEAKRTSNNADKLAKLISASINQVYIAGNGARKTIYIPNSMNGVTGYNITISGTTVDVSYERAHVQDSLVTSRISGAFSKGYNNITNNYGEIIISS